MKLASLWFDDVVVIALGKSNGEGEARQNLQELSFHAEDGWDLDEVAPGRFRIWREGMPKPVTVGGHGFQFTEADEQPAPEAPTGLESKRRGKR